MKILVITEAREGKLNPVSFEALVAAQQIAERGAAAPLFLLHTHRFRADAQPSSGYGGIALRRR